MRERLNTAIEKKLSEGEEEEHLTRQLTLIQSAQIITIDSFCSYILKSYFHVIGLDPNYRVMDEGEGKLLKTQVVQELLESYFEEATPEFQEFVECLATGKNDQILEDSILRLYEFAMSYPYPEKWLEECLAIFSRIFLICTVTVAISPTMPFSPIGPTSQICWNSSSFGNT